MIGPQQQRLGQADVVTLQEPLERGVVEANQAMLALADGIYLAGRRQLGAHHGAGFAWREDLGKPLAASFIMYLFSSTPRH
jgi:hypothetical protein